jgi:hypothetical protein
MIVDQSEDDSADGHIVNLLHFESC